MIWWHLILDCDTLYVVPIVCYIEFLVYLLEECFIWFNIYIVFATFLLI